MEREAVIHLIVQLCIEPDGLLYTTDPRREFDSPRFDQLIHALQHYQALLGFEAQIDRRVSGYVYELARVIDTAWVVSTREDQASAITFEGASIELDEVAGQLFFWGQGDTFPAS